MLIIVAINLTVTVGANSATAAPCEALSRTRSKWPSCDSSAHTQKISFVHVSDMHAQYNPGPDGTTPAGRIRGYYQLVKDENPFTLFTDAGDDYEKGSIAEELSQGESTREVVNAMRYDVRTLGNHDFAWGIEELLKFSHDPSAVVLATNTTMSREVGAALPGGSPGWTDFAVLTVGCVRIGFFGLVTKPWGEDDQQYDGPFYRDIPTLQTDFHFIERGREVIAKHRHEVDVLVLVSHLGLPDDISLAEQTDGIDLILGGHTHSIMSHPQRIKNTSIVHVGAFAQKIGRFDMEYDLLNKRITGTHFDLVANQEGEIAVDQCTEGEVTGILKKFERELHEPITDVNHDQNKQAVAVIAARAAVETLKTDAALVNVKTVWQEWRQGGLSQQDILNTFRVEREPSGSSGSSSLYLLEVKGEDLLEATARLTDCVYWGPSAIAPAAVYTVAMQKTQAFNQQKLFGKQIGISPPRPAAELWRTVVANARDHKVAGLSLDEGFRDLKNKNQIALLQGHDSVLPAKQNFPENLE